MIVILVYSMGLCFKFSYTTCIYYILTACPKLNERNVIRLYTVVLYMYVAATYPKFVIVEYLIQVSFHESKYTQYTQDNAKVHSQLYSR